MPLPTRLAHRGLRLRPLRLCALLSLLALVVACSEQSGPSGDEQLPPAPSASFTATPASGTAPLPVTFDATASTGEGLTFAWEFGDGSGAVGVTTSRTFGSAGAFEVTLTVTDAHERTDTATKQVLVSDPSPDTPEGPRFVSVSAGAGGTLALGSDGNLYAWGDGTRGQNGTALDDHELEPVPVVGLEGAPLAFHRGYAHSLVVLADGAAVAWGWNLDAALGTGDEEDRWQAHPVMMPEGVRFEKVAASRYSFALDQDGRGWAWGVNLNGSLGIGSYQPASLPTAIQMPAGTRFTQIESYFGVTIALDQAGTVWTWGRGRYGALGAGTEVTGDRVVPGPIDAPAEMGAVLTVGVHSNTAAALDEHGQVWTWGSNHHGELGDGTEEPRFSPGKVQQPEGVLFEDLAVGDFYMVALDQSGRAWSWGSNTSGRLGVGEDPADLGRSALPMPVAMPDGVRFTAVTVGSHHAVAIDQDGNAWAWGYNSRGRLGDGTTEDRWEPTLVKAPW